MMAVVTERRKKIGLRKALGAANKSSVLEFLGEGVFLGGIGGLLGAGFGFFFAQMVSMNVFSRSITFQPLLLPVTLAASAVVAIFGLIRAKRRTPFCIPA
ncbi:MAG: FtsX-like permease family protein [Clostridiales bacterium]|jgi:putative ABC transport system permease protein|nr:FtsX-like permease family protein [Clostridiales bacterium]